MITTALAILVCINTTYPGNKTITFQEFNTMEQCKYVAGLLHKESGVTAYCVAK